MISWLVVADDWSGAAELGAAAARRGRKTALTRGAPPPPGTDVWVVDTATRDLPQEEARRRLDRLGPALKALPAARAFKKIDSVLRGRPGMESEWLASLLGLGAIHAVPGNPRRGRRVIGGELWVDGVRLDRSAFQDDPHYPARTASVDALWQQGGGTPGRAVLARDVDEAALSGWAARTDSGVLAVGALDFFEACLGGPGQGHPAELPRVRSVWVACGSRAGWPERERHFLTRKWSVITSAAAFPSVEGCTLWGLGNEPLAAPQLALAALARRLAADAKKGGPGLWCLEGGATAAAVLEACGWDSLELVGEVAPGTALLRPSGGNALVLVKPGSYPWPSSVREAWESAARPLP